MKDSLKVNKMQQFSRNDAVVHKKNIKYNGFFKLEEYHVSHLLFMGGTSQIFAREVFERGDAVVVIPYDPVLDSVVLVEQFRAGALRTQNSPWLLEFIAGMFSEDESPVDVAIREAKEEANLSIEEKDIEHVMNYLSSPGGMSEEIHLFVAKVDSVESGGVFGLDEEQEDILVHVVPREKALGLLKQGSICNAATVIGL